MGRAADLTNWMGETATSVYHALEDIKNRFNGVFNPPQPDVHTKFIDANAMRTLYEEVKDWAGGAMEGLSVMITEVKHVTEDITVKRLTGASSLVILTSPNCALPVFEDALQTIQISSEAMYWLAGANFRRGKLACDMIVPAYQDAEKFLHSCVDSQDSVYKDAAQVIAETRKTIHHFCSNEHYRQHFTRCGCMCSCTKRNMPMLKKMGLAGPASRTANVQHHLGDICKATQNVNQCVTQTACAQKPDEKMESMVSSSLDGFCSRYQNWDPANAPPPAPAPPPQDAEVEAKPDNPAEQPAPDNNTPQEEVESKSRGSSLKAAFYYLSFIIFVVF